MSDTRIANVIGMGLIGGSIALALKAGGWNVWGDDQRDEVVAQALELDVIDEPGLNEHATMTFVAVPVMSVTAQIERALAVTSGIVTDVGSVKGPIVNSIDSPRFIGGHPMAGSEFSGLDGATADLFRGAVWVLTPTDDTDDAALSQLSAAVNTFGAEPIALPAAQHDRVVAVVSHVPHLTAAMLMKLAADRSIEHNALLRLAAGGFRDMTRIASGHPTIWLDICTQNREAITDALDDLIGELTTMRHLVAVGDRDELSRALSKAREARTNLPSRVTNPESLAEVRIPIPDRKGAAAEVFTLAAEVGVNIANFEVVHSAESNRGVAVVLVDASTADLFRGGLIARGFRPAVTPLS